MPERTAYFFQQFVNGAIKGNPFHPLDMRRFYEFIHAAHQGRTRLTEADVEALLLSHGFSDCDSERLASIYNHGRELLRHQRSFNYVPWKKSR